MKIGILTYHRGHNFGALMQAVASRFFLQKKGHQVYYIDYWPKYHQRMYSHFDWLWFIKIKSIRKKINLVKNAILYWKECDIRIKKMKYFISCYIEPYCLPYKSNDTFDMVLYGSDQIWRKQSRNNNQYNPVYFAENAIKASKHYAWAASMGVLKWNKNDKEWIKSHLNNFDYITVRESSLHAELLELSISSKILCDPTLLLTNKEWNAIFPDADKRMVDKPYLLYYKIREGINAKSAKDIAKKNNLVYISLFGSPEKKQTQDVYVSTSPIEMLSLIKHAEFVVTSSFHGIAFCILYHIDFYAAFSNNKGRAESLLNNLGLEDRLLSNNACIPNLSHINWNEVEVKLDKYRKKSYTCINDMFVEGSFSF